MKILNSLCEIPIVLVSNISPSHKGNHNSMSSMFIQQWLQNCDNTHTTAGQQLPIQINQALSKVQPLKLPTGRNGHLMEHVCAHKQARQQLLGDGIGSQEATSMREYSCACKCTLPTWSMPSTLCYGAAVVQYSPQREACLIGDHSHMDISSAEGPGVSRTDAKRLRMHTRKPHVQSESHVPHTDRWLLSVYMT